MVRLARLFLLTGCVAFAGSSAFGATGGTCPSSVPSNVTNCYYVDYNSGSDSNTGISEASPWQHAPGMQTCTGTCHSTAISGGTGIILKGGVTWPNASFEWSLPGGASGNPVYIGVDKGWFAGSSWARPTMSAGGSLIGNNRDTMFYVPANITIDNLEITGYYWDAATCNGAPYGSCAIFSAGQTSGQTWQNLYIHGWSHAGSDASSSAGVINIFTFGGNGQGTVHDSVFMGTDVPGDHSVNVFFNGPGVAYNNYIQQVSSGFITSYSNLIHDNYIADIGPAYCNMPVSQYAGYCTHENGFEDNGDIGLSFYNNVVTNVSTGLAIWIAPNPGYTAYLWNNVVYAVHDNQVLDFAPPVYNSTYCSTGKTSNGYCTNGGSFVVENNTVECGDDTTRYDVCQSGVGVFAQSSSPTSTVYQNNHFISATTASGCSSAAVNCTFASNNVVQTLSTANSQGYSSTELHAFSPSSSGGATVKAGVNLSSTASGNLAPLSKITSYACALSGTATSCNPNPPYRPSTGNWDAGAYMYGLASPAVPTNVNGSLVVK